jgi:caffeoyl-CoA O-methyltransferase
MVGEMSESNSMREQFDDYIGSLFIPQQDETLEWIRTQVERHDMPAISVRPYEGYLLGWLVRLIRANVVVEIGTLAGYSGTWIARSLPEDGKLYTVEVSSKHAEVARASFDKAGLNGKVEILQGNGLQILKKLEAKAPFDMVFIDADKESYPLYLEWAVRNVRSGGMVAAHNAYRHGAILNPQNDVERATAAFNKAIATHPELDSMIIPLGDAMAVGVKR